MTPDIQLAESTIKSFCQKWGIVRLELFGSVLRDDFGPESDIDFLVSFAPDARVSLFDLMHIENEMAEMVGRKVHLVCRESVEQSRNWIRRRAILESAEPYYVA